MAPTMRPVATTSLTMTSIAASARNSDATASTAPPIAASSAPSEPLSKPLRQPQRPRRRGLAAADPCLEAGRAGAGGIPRTRHAAMPAQPSSILPGSSTLLRSPGSDKGSAPMSAPRRNGTSARLRGQDRVAAAPLRFRTGSGAVLLRSRWHDVVPLPPHVAVNAPWQAVPGSAGSRSEREVRRGR